MDIVQCSSGANKHVGVIVYYYFVCSSYYITVFVIHEVEAGGVLPFLFFSYETLL